MRRGIPDAWRVAFERRGLHSGRDLARAMDVSPQTVQRLLHGGPTSKETIDAAAMTLGVSPNEIRRWRQERPRQPFVLPPEADDLDEKQRQVVLSVVRAILDAAAGADAEDDPSVVELRAARRVSEPKRREQVEHADE